MPDDGLNKIENGQRKSERERARERERERDGDSLYSNSHYGHSQCCDSRYGVAFLFPLRLWLRFLRLQRRFARYLGWFHQGAAGMGLDSSGRLWPRANLIEQC